MRFPETPSSRSARLEGWGGPPISGLPEIGIKCAHSGLPEIGINVRKSGKPDLRCSRRRARGCGIYVDSRLRLLTMRAERSRVCVKLIGIRFSRRSLPVM
jgi:hypothetical protein